MRVLATKNLSVNFGGNSVLQDINIHIERGEIVTIVGPNGSGKSTLLRAIIGAQVPTSGQVEIISKQIIGYVPQRLNIDETLPMTVYRFLSLPKRQQKDDMETALQQAGLSGLGKHQLSTLSGGQFQRVLLARALIEIPDLLLLDEATQGLDHSGSADFYRQIERVRQELGCAILMVSHELHTVMRTSDRVICLNGRICCEGAPEVVRVAPEYRLLFGLDNAEMFASYDNQNHHHDHAAPQHEEAV
ncbi:MULTISPECIES: metal ABC transporter ATP-binding protein [unclassified Marinobacter]|uniref:metal ABC transporter ATP-binding protein n=1 Tax=unclassified Marinobacter TaxID=83889 RepID=UPI00200F74DD|nr:MULTISPECIES: metal ABC transporter ATP-binding protein [unclassified Marinobacter]MCL1479393.1 metal ABC transporter ATP-binding protein [Marinobacter sp.]MCL1484379.1 metal ABC transporter ATP-binding protein [Marinobacter sp.]UQG57981.1 metal ABC transporter ATP-binding protein [Marinobacter sp. M4C]UQG66786.1 metal ABC transporter ATP-binding protein [Marinobacter sp. M2C]UQG71066.1 metal ABC transporter ATP-binding protein [Marinobacter sp. M1C]